MASNKLAHDDQHLSVLEIFRMPHVMVVKGDKSWDFFPFGRISGPVLDGGMSDPLQQLRQRCVLLTGGISCTTGNPDKSQAEAGGWWLRHYLGVFFFQMFIYVFICAIYKSDTPFGSLF